ncbi:hypothetical protein NM208_g10092 [Fusarium decemcellulare]|uniref:Uncharacterized protein n=1 Tax=Fusarium decemcellulare TaxID=57161 RepID=A0ACC1RZA1_9HYPO|nr:hypothetical protein NM208_g10092 [Fusarium decemcellulare]
MPTHSTESCVQHKTSNSQLPRKSDCQVWPGKDHWKQKAKANKAKNRCTCMAHLSRRNRIIVKCLIVFLVVGVAVGVGFGRDYLPFMPFRDLRRHMFEQTTASNCRVSQIMRVVHHGLHHVSPRWAPRAQIVRNKIQLAQGKSAGVATTLWVLEMQVLVIRSQLNGGVDGLDGQTGQSRREAADGGDPQTSEASGGGTGG